MLAFLLKLVPFRDYAYAALAAAAIAWFLHHDSVERAAGAAREVAAVREATAKALAAEQATIDKLNADHAKDLTAVQVSYEQTINANNASHASDLQRLRNAARNSNGAAPVLDSAIGGSAAATEAGASSVNSLGSVPANIALQLVDALRADDAALDKCYADRDDLTGK